MNISEVHFQQFFLCISETLARYPVDIEYLPRGIVNKDRVAGIVEQYFVTLFRGPQFLTGTPAFGFHPQCRDSLREIAGKFGQQIHFIRVECVGFRGINAQSADTFSFAAQRNRHTRGISLAESVRAPEFESGIGQNMLHYADLPGPNGRTCGTLSAFIVGIGEIQGIQIIIFVSPLRRGQDAFVFVMFAESHPGHTVFSFFHHNPAYIFDEFGFIRGMGQGFVACTQHSERAVEFDEFFPGLFPLNDFSETVGNGIEQYDLFILKRAFIAFRLFFEIRNFETARFTAPHNDVSAPEPWSFFKIFCAEFLSSYDGPGAGDARILKSSRNQPDNPLNHFFGRKALLVADFRDTVKAVHFSDPFVQIVSPFPQCGFRSPDPQHGKYLSGQFRFINRFCQKRGGSQRQISEAAWGI